MKFVALARVEVLVPFEFDAPDLRLDEYVGNVGDGTGIVDVDAYEKRLAEVERGRTEAARHAEAEVFRWAKESAGDAISAVVVEVREA